MNIIFATEAWEDYLFWQKAEKKILKRINMLIKEIKINQDEGIGKPEKLKHTYAGYSSRRITDEHRIVYKLIENQLHIAQVRYHY